MLAYQSEEIHGLGVALGARGHAVRFWHSGANGSFKCLFEGYPETSQGLAMMTNGDSGLSLIDDIQRAVAQEYGWPDGRVEEHTLAKIDAASLRAYTSLSQRQSAGSSTISRDHPDPAGGSCVNQAVMLRFERHWRRRNESRSSAWFP